MFVLFTQSCRDSVKLIFISGCHVYHLTKAMIYGAIAILLFLSTSRKVKKCVNYLNGKATRFLSRLLISLFKALLCYPPSRTVS